MKEKMILVRLTIERFKSFVEYNSLRPKIEIAPKTGIDIKKEILDASTLLKFKNRAPVIVIPDLLTPGIRERTWNNPITKAFFKVNHHIWEKS